MSSIIRVKSSSWAEELIGGVEIGSDRPDNGAVIEFEIRTAALGLFTEPN
jgi:hypothetical protein